MNMMFSTINNSVRFNFLFETSFNKLTALQRVRVKVDPLTVLHADDLSECPSYEGYVLEENNGVIKILMVQPSVGIENIPVNNIEPVENDCEMNIFDELKHYILQDLELQENDPLFTQITNCSNLDEIETFLLQSGFSEGDIAELYKNFITL